MPRLEREAFIDAASGTRGAGQGDGVMTGADARDWMTAQAVQG